MKLTDSNQLPWQVYTHPREGTAELKVLAAAESSPGMNFFFILVRYGSHETFQTPRHHHTFEQIRYSVDGALNYAKGKDLPEGWIGYFPAGAYYGPQRVERHQRRIAGDHQHVRSRRIPDWLIRRPRLRALRPRSHRGHGQHR